MDADEVSENLGALLHPAVDGETLANFLKGLMAVSPDALLNSKETIAHVDACVSRLSHEQFMRVLPDLRQAFADLKPLQTHALAAQIAAFLSVGADQIEVALAFPPETLTEAAEANARLRESLFSDGLGQWVQA